MSPLRVVECALPSDIPRERDTIVTVGTFDGVHLGHREVLKEIRRRALATGRRGVLLTFDPHPLQIVRPEHAPPLLTTTPEKKEILAGSGLDHAVFLAFTSELSRYEPRRFVTEVLLDRLGVEELVIGHDHGFGHGRAGDVETLQQLGEELGFATDVVPPVVVDGEPVSSSAIRAALAAGDPGAAARALGRPYSLRGLVVRGEGRGRQLGFPTANLAIASRDKLIPASGIYAVRGITSAGTFDGALHLGPRPTFPGSPPSIEIYLLDFDGDLYGEEIRVDFVQYLRAVRPFDGVPALIAQIGEDVEAARRALASVGGR